MLLTPACVSRSAWFAVMPTASRQAKPRAPGASSARAASSRLGIARREVDEEPEDEDNESRINALLAPALPPPKPLAPHITLYADSSFPSKLAHSLLSEVSLSRRPVRSADLAAKSALRQASARLGTFLTRRIDNPFPLPMRYERVAGRGPEGEELDRWRAIRREEDEARSLRGAPSALLLHPDESIPASASASHVLQTTCSATAVTAAEPARTQSVGPAEPRLPLCVNWTTRESFQGPYMFSGVEKMVKSMRTAQEARFAAEKEYDAFLKQLGQRPPARDKPETDRARWWEVAFAVAFASAVEWQFDLLGLRTFIVRERRKWGYKT